MKHNRAVWFVWGVPFLLMAILPLVTLSKAMGEIRPLYVSAYVIGVMVFTVIFYRADKRSAESGKWRVSERTLHFWELAGGWMAAYWMQRLMRHKIRKLSYQISFWAIGFVHQYMAFDYLHDWQYTERLLRYMQ